MLRRLLDHQIQKQKCIIAVLYVFALNLLKSTVPQSPLPNSHRYQMIYLRCVWPLWCANLILEPETQLLDRGAVSHELRKFGCIGIGHIHNRRNATGHSDVATGAPRVGIFLVFGAQVVVMQEFGTLGLRGVLEDRSVLWPGDKGCALGRVRTIERCRWHEPVGGAEGHSVGVVWGSDELRREVGAACPSRVLKEERLPPGEPVVSHTNSIIC